LIRLESFRLKSVDLLIVTLFMQLTLLASSLFHFSIVQQVIGFVYYTYFPGLIFSKILRFEKTSTALNVVMRVGLSIAFLMLAGLVVNQLFPLVGINPPLTSSNLQITINVLMLFGVFLAIKRGGTQLNWPVISLPKISIILIIIPILSVFGALIVNIYNSNLVILFDLVLIAILFSVVVVSSRFLSPKFYSLFILSISIAIILQSSLISYNIVTFGSDIPSEYLAYTNTQQNMQWSIANPISGDAGFGRYNSMLSITILPTMYFEMLGIDSAIIFKLIFPLLFSLVPVCLYFLWKSRIGEKYALVSTFLFMAQATFFTEMLGLARQMIAELFFVLLLFVILSKDMKYLPKLACFLVFGTGLIVSHYALAEIFLFFAICSILIIYFLKRSVERGAISFAVIFSVIMFAWYLFTSSGASFDSLVSFGNYVFNQLGNFFDFASRGNTVLVGLGLGQSPSLWNSLSRLFAYATEGLIAIGFVSLFVHRPKGSKHVESYFIFTSVAFGLLVALIAIPGLANTMNMTRFYHILLFLLAPLCVLGAQFFANYFKTGKIMVLSIILIALLVPYFLFQTGFVYELTSSSPTSISLSKNRIDPLLLFYGFGYSDVCSNVGAKWLSSNVNLKLPIYSDRSSLFTSLRIYGNVYNSNPLTNGAAIPVGSAIYLNTLNTVYNTFADQYSISNSSDFSSIFSSSILIYNNGNSIVYRYSG
jgi:uncharacterized membrane protein